MKKKKTWLAAKPDLETQLDDTETQTFGPLEESVVETIEPSNGYKVLKAVTFARVFYSPGEMIVCSPEQADLLRSVGAIE